ncbi:hypothetical protein [Streptomyces sp. OP7]
MDDPDRGDLPGQGESALRIARGRPREEEAAGRGEEAAALLPVPLALRAG